jgi:hypothetical protein
MMICSGTPARVLFTLALVVGAGVTSSVAQILVSQGKPVVASSTESASFPATNAVDGNTATRWSSAFSDPQWIRIDLGNLGPLVYNRVVLTWEAAYAKAYQIQTSNDLATWTTIYSTTTGDGGTDDLALNGGSSARYVRLFGTARATQWGYSLWEFRVYAPPDATPTNTPTPTSTATPTPTTPNLETRLTLPYNVNAAYNDGATFTSAASIDGTGSAYSSTLLGPALSWAGTGFNIGTPNQLNGARNTTIALPTGSGTYTTLLLLGTGVNGDQLSQTLRLNYSDGTFSTFTQTFSNWLNTNQNVAGQQIAKQMAYRNKSTGVKDNRTFNLYGYTIPLFADRTPTSLVLPANNNVVILAVTLRRQPPPTPTPTSTATSTPTPTTTSGAHPNAPANLRAAPSQGQVILTWSFDNVSQTYQILRREAAGCNTVDTVIAMVNPTGSATMSYTDTGLTDKVQYVYSVRGALGVNFGPASVIATTPQLFPPPAPTLTSAVFGGNGTGRVDLTWTVVSGATGYVVNRGTAGCCSTVNGWTVIATLGANVTSYSDASLAPFATYVYTVSSVNAAGTGAASNRLSVFVQSATPRATPTQCSCPTATPTATPIPLRATPRAPQPTAAGGENRVFLHWPAVGTFTDPEKAQGYSVYRSTTSCGPYLKIAGPGISIGDATGIFYVDGALTNGTTYNYTVAGVNSIGEGLASSVVSTAPQPVPPAAPQGQAAELSPTIVQVAWVAQWDADSYRVARATTPGGPYTTLVTGIASAGHGNLMFYNDSTVTVNGTYYYVIVATNPAGSSPNSNEASLTITP